MNRFEFELFLKNMLPNIDPSAFDLIEKYKQFLVFKNKTKNLTRLDKDELIYDSYFLESILPFLKLGFNNLDLNLKILDIGSGSGIPGVMLKIIFPKSQITLLDSNLKKTKFLNELIEYLGLKDIEIVNQRAEIYGQKIREKFDIVTSRAVSSLNKILELSSCFVKINGLIVEPKSLNADKEFEDSKKAIKLLNLELDKKIVYDFNAHTHVVFCFKKIDKTDLKYPRCWSKIIKNPL